MSKQPVQQGGVRVQVQAGRGFKESKDFQAELYAPARLHPTSIDSKDTNKVTESTNTTKTATAAVMQKE
jgi:hypothetical protein